MTPCLASGKTVVMSRPLIGVSSRPRKAGDVHLWPDTPAAVMQYTYIDALWRAGGMEAIIAPRFMGDDEADELVSRLDGLILVGGGDVDPMLYGAERNSHVYGVEPASDSLELALVQAGMRAGIPMLLICRGMQVLNVALNGTLDQHLTGREGLINHGQPGEGFALHESRVEPGSLLAKTLGGATGVENCWSYHHQAVGQLGDGLVVSARSSDGVIEAVEFHDALDAPWMLALQWHPERTAHDDPVQQLFFDELVRQAAP
jgi:putative glutamine amidotransferase